MKTKLKKLIYLLVIIVIGYSGFSYLKSVPKLQPSYLSFKVTPPSTLTWPTQGESAVGVVGSNILETNGNQLPKPIASAAKLVTALMVLRAKPLKLNQQGPIITLNQNDVNIYRNYLNEQGSIAPIVNNEQISEYQMLEAMLLPSADNIADSLAIWAYGSLANYSLQANNWLKDQGLNETTVGSDASGYSPSTTSTPEDMVKIGEMIEKNPVLAGIVDESSATIPVAGTIHNINNLLGDNNIVGIKTGNTTQAGGVFVGAVKFSLGNTIKTVVTANMGAPDLNDAMLASLTLLKSVQSNFPSTLIARTGSMVATYYVPWTKTNIPVQLQNNLEANIWGGESLSVHIGGLPELNYQTQAGSLIGKVYPKNLTSLPVAVKLSQTIPRPSFLWKLIHP
jgi:D-alanyl-D-alanine carboxypeptidase (penicillin-binding protein 5/6)